MVHIQEHQILIGSESIPLLVEKGRAGRIRMSFVPGENTLKLESGTGRMGAMEKEFLESRHKWILKVFRFRSVALKQREDFLANLDEMLPLLGNTTPVEFHSAPITSFKYNRGGALRIYAPDRYLKKHRNQLIFFALRKFADNYLPERLDYWAKETNLSYNKLRIKDLSSKWGSCSSKRNINLNWQLVFLEEDLIDYVIIHELMHLREMNHSPKFWNWVAKYYPDHKKARLELKKRSWLVGVMKPISAKKSA